VSGSLDRPAGPFAQTRTRFVFQPVAADAPVVLQLNGLLRRRSGSSPASKCATR